MTSHVARSRVQQYIDPHRSDDRCDLQASDHKDKKGGGVSAQSHGWDSLADAPLAAARQRVKRAVQDWFQARFGRRDGFAVGVRRIAPIRRKLRMSASKMFGAGLSGIGCLWMGTDAMVMAAQQESPS